MLHKLVFRLIFLCAVLGDACLGHAVLQNPPPRSPHVNNCGYRRENDGVGVGQTTVPGLECGVCGDDLALAQPRPNEYKGKFGQSGPQAVYRQSDIIEVKADVRNPHKGFMQWRLCENQLIETQDCFNENLLEVVEASVANMSNIGVDTFQVNVTIAHRPNGNSLYVTAKLRLPAEVYCSNCVIQYNYRAGRSWLHYRPDEMAQETFRSCADVRIISSRAPLELLQNAESGKCIGQVVGSNFNLELQECDAQGILPMEEWENYRYRNNSILIEATGKCLDVKGESVSAGASILQIDCSRKDHQLWHIRKDTAKSGFIEIISKKSGLCLSGRGTSVIQQSCEVSSSKWKVLYL